MYHGHGFLQFLFGFKAILRTSSQFKGKLAALNGIKFSYIYIHIYICIRANQCELAFAPIFMLYMAATWWKGPHIRFINKHEQLAPDSLLHLLPHMLGPSSLQSKLTVHHVVDEGLLHGAGKEVWPRSPRVQGHICCSRQKNGTMDKEKNGRDNRCGFHDAWFYR